MIRALGQKKQRKAHGLFLVQGEKNVLELTNSTLKVQHIFATAEFLAEHAQALAGFECIEATLDDLTKVSTLVSNNAAIAVVAIPHIEVPKAQGLMIALDGVSDPVTWAPLFGWRIGMVFRTSSPAKIAPTRIIRKPSAPRWAALAACKSAKWIYLTT